ncbi:hypothetical protein [Rothia aeria]|uniref:hypothetical protein n=1 Tax=Rothia aeria TaxID=172042 RepID=UPI000A40D56B
MLYKVVAHHAFISIPSPEQLFLLSIILDALASYLLHQCRGRSLSCPFLLPC